MIKRFFIHTDEPGHIETQFQKVMRKAVDSLPVGRFLVEFKSKNRRTLNQNDYIHVLFTLIQKGLYDVGYREIKTMEQAKEFCKYRFLRQEVVNELTGEISVSVRPTSSLTKEEMMIFIDELVQFSAEYLGIVVPDCNEYKNNPKRYDQFSVTYN